MRNSFFDLCPELIQKIFEYDNTYKEKYDMVIITIKKFPEFKSYDKVENMRLRCYFQKKYYNIKHIDLTDDFYCTDNCYKKAFLIVIKAFSKPNTIK